MELSIIITSYNTKQLLLDCVNSILKYTKNLKYEVIVVDNNSNDGSANAIQKSKVKVIQSTENNGFGVANNKGVAIAKGKYILFLNSDTLITDNVLCDMVEWMNLHPKTGVTSCALKNKDGSIQGTGGFFPTLPKVFAWMFFLEDIPGLDKLIKPFHPVHGQSFLYNGMSQFLKKREQDWVTGAFMMIPKKVLESIGAFDPDYFMYTEEVDLCYRIKKAGYEIWYLPKWSITHLGGASSTKEFSLLSEFKSMKIFYKKNMPAWQMPILRFFLKCGALLRIPIFGILKGKEVANTYAKAFQLA